ncbi:MAG: IS1 family transposase [Candidatus Binatia bacterium]
MNTLSRERKAQIIRCLIEGNSVCATCRITGVSKGAILKLLQQVGDVCWEYQHDALRNLTCQRIQCDEIWQYVRMKEKQAKRKGSDRPADVGDVWTWVAIDADTKLVPSWFIGGRDARCAYEFMLDLESRLAHRVQLTTDGHKAYLSAVGGAFGSTGIDYAMLVKVYGAETQEEHRYSPAVCIGCDRTRVYGDPDPKHVSTSYIERQNLTMRMGMRRYTRLTNGFSKNVGNHAYMTALHFMHYNFCRVHQSLRVTPAMEAKIMLPNGKTKALADHIWDVEDIVDLLPNKAALR